MIRRLAFAIIRRYPPAWRERYEAEVCALIAQSGVRAGDLAELVRGLLTERAAELLLNDERPRRTMVFLGLMKPVFSIALVATAALTGYALRRVTGPWSEGAREVALVPLIVFSIIFFTVLFRKRRPWSSVEPAYSAPVGAAMLSAFFVAVVCVHWGQLFGPSPDEGPHSVGWLAANPWVFWWGYLGPVADLASSLWPAQRMLHAFGALHGAEAQIRSNQLWVDGCHTMIAQGVPSPLAEAEAQVAHWTRERDLAREQLHALGYRARFRT